MAEFDSIAIHDGLYMWQALYYAYGCLCRVFYYLSIFLIVDFGRMGLIQIARFLHFNFGQRIKPSGKKGVIITGATSGIGLAVAKLMYKRGFTVFACYYNNREQGYSELMQLAQDGKEKKEIEKDHDQDRQHMFLIPMDVRSGDSIEKSRDEIFSLLDKHDIKLHCILNNAGIAISSSPTWTDRESIQSTLDTNLTGSILVAQSFLHRIIVDRGRVINVSSGLKYIPIKEAAYYGATKSAIAYYSLALNQELKEYGLMCCCLLPGNLLTTSDIIFQQYKLFKKMLNKLSPQEAATYKHSIDERSKMVHSLLLSKLVKTDHTLEQIASIYDIDLPDMDTIKKLAEMEIDVPPMSLFNRFVVWIFSIMDGSSNSPTIEGSGVLDSYEYAICAREPEPIIHPGNFMYTHIFGHMKHMTNENFLDQLSPYVSYTLRGY